MITPGSVYPIPDANHACWQKLAARQAPGFVPKLLGLQFLFTRLTQEDMSLDEKAREIHAFFVRYDRIAAWELSELKRLNLL